jgi:streptogramin lyase
LKIHRIARALGALVSAAIIAALLAPAALASTPTASELSALPTSGSQPDGIATGPDGNLWFTELGAHKIGRITPAGAVSEVSLPVGTSPVDITGAPDGNVWFTLASVGGGAIGKIDLTNPLASPTFVATPTTGSFPAGIAVGADGNLWFTEAGPDKIGRVTLSTGTVTEFGDGITAGANPSRIAAGTDGKLWFTENGIDSIGRINPFDTAAGTSEFGDGISADAQPADIASGPDGAIWFTEVGGIGRFDPADTAAGADEFRDAAGFDGGALVQGIAAAADGNLWFSDGNHDAVGRITPGGVVTEFTSGITTGAEPDGIAAGPDGNLWFTEHAGNRIARINTALDAPAFQNAAAISIPEADVREASPYPADVLVSGLQGTVTDVNVRLTGLSHLVPLDLDVLLVGPGGQATKLIAQDDFLIDQGLSLGFDDEASSLQRGVSGIYRPGTGTMPTMPSPAPPGPYGAVLSAFDGTNPNGTWSLYIRDRDAGAGGAIFGGWGLDIETTGDTTPPNTSITSSAIDRSRRRATFKFTSTELPATFSCKLDGGSFTSCRSPKTYRSLSRGQHTFRVRARDAAGNVDPVPAQKRFRI